MFHPLSSLVLITFLHLILSSHYHSSPRAITQVHLVDYGKLLVRRNVYAFSNFSVRFLFLYAFHAVFILLIGLMVLVIAYNVECAMFASKSWKMWAHQKREAQPKESFWHATWNDLGGSSARSRKIGAERCRRDHDTTRHKQQELRIASKRDLTTL